MVNNILTIPKVNEGQAYRLGYDCGFNGPTEENCHFSIFMKWQNTRSWEKGVQDARDKIEHNNSTEESND